MKSLPGRSAYTGTLPTGCTMCAKGAKMVLFISGICDAKCFYCPISEQKKMKDVMYADEMPISGFRDAIFEANMIQATGTGITGGDPLKFYERTSDYIRALKDNFGEKHHIHLYSISGSKEGIESVARAGLDEIRFHPPEEIWSHMDRSIFRDRIKWARDSGMNVGIEVPSLPGRTEDMKNLIDFSRRMELDFINLNELEFSETNFGNLLGHDYSVKNDVESGTKGSQELAIKMVKDNPDFTVHYCSASFKDSVQLKNRLKRRAKNVARDIDVITKDGTIIKGIIEGGKAEEIMASLTSIGVPESMMQVNSAKRRVEIAPWLVEDLKGKIQYELYEVEEYPTWDALEVERLRIN